MIILAYAILVILVAFLLISWTLLWKYDKKVMRMNGELKRQLHQQQLELEKLQTNKILDLQCHHPLSTSSSFVCSKSDDKNDS